MTVIRQQAGRYLTAPSFASRRRPLSSSSDSASKPPPPPSAKEKTRNPSRAEDASPSSPSSSSKPAHSNSISTEYGLNSSRLPPGTTTERQHLPPSLLERLTGLYSENSGVAELSTLKSAVADASASFDAAVRSVTDLRRAVDAKTAEHDGANRRHASMLMRRDAWDADDATAFAEATSAEVQARRDLADAREDLREAEDGAGRRQVEYMDAMRRRYHEEQLWQEKWRVLSTYWTWGLIGLNSFIFVGGQIFHYRRESGRLKRIEELIIGEKILSGSSPPERKHQEELTIGEGKTAAARENHEAETTAVAVDLSPAELISETDSLVSAGAVADIASARHADDESSLPVIHASREGLPEEERVDQSQVDSPENRTLSTWSEKARNVLLLQTVRQKRTKGNLERRNDVDAPRQHKNNQKDGTVPIWSDATSAISKMARDTEVHWPSAAIGAAAGAMGILILTCLEGRK